MEQRRGLLIILSSPSGAGKSTLARRLRDWDPSIRFSVSATTRPPRPGEEHGREYYFHSRAEFEQMVARDEMLEHAEVFGNFYGTSQGALREQLAQGLDVIVEIDWQGARQVRERMGNPPSIFILPPSIEELRRRLTGRGQDSEAIIDGRMAKAQAEISHYGEFDFLVVNDRFEGALAELQAIITAQRSVQARRAAELAPLLAAMLPAMGTS